jgi:hypothetical protein
VLTAGPIYPSHTAGAVAAGRPIAFPVAAAISVHPLARRTAATPASASASSPAAPSRRPGDYRIDEGVSLRSGGGSRYAASGGEGSTLLSDSALKIGGCARDHW